MYSSTGGKGKKMINSIKSIGKKVINYSLMSALFLNIMSEKIVEPYRYILISCDSLYRSCLNKQVTYDPWIRKGKGGFVITGDIEMCNKLYTSCEENKELQEYYLENKKHSDGLYLPIKNRHDITQKTKNKENISKRDLIKYLSSLEKEFGFKKGFLIGVAHIESDFNYDAVSHKKAYGVLQIKREAFDDLKRIYSLSKHYVEKYVEKSSLSFVNIKNPYTFEFVKLRGKGLDKKLERDIKYYYVPVFIALNKHKEILHKSWRDVASNPINNALSGALYMYVIKTDLNTLQLIKEKGKYKLIRRPPSHFENKDYLKIIPETHQIYLWIVYNMGITRFKEYLKKYGHLWEVLRHIPRETRKGMSKLRFKMREFG